MLNRRKLTRKVLEPVDKHGVQLLESNQGRRAGAQHVAFLGGLRFLKIVDTFEARKHWTTSLSIFRSHPPCSFLSRKVEVSTWLSLHQLDIELSMWSLSRPILLALLGTGKGG